VLSAFAEGSLFGERHGSAPLAVLALHGWGRTHRDFDSVLSPQDGEELDAVALDLPGFGATPAPDQPWSSQDFADAVLPVLDEATEPVVVVGHSHGGRVALCLASRRPASVKALVLIGAPILRRSSMTKPKVSYRVARRLRRLHLISEARFEARRRRSGSADYNAAQGSMRDTLVTVVNESFEEELRRLSCPVYLLWGADDSDVPLEIAERALELVGAGEPEAHRPLVVLEVIPGIGHLVPSRDPASVRRVLEQALA
jgi:pimeloyl-ACP methyl ester carboxylesterase